MSWLIGTWHNNCNEWKAENRHMHRQIQRHYDLLKLQWQLYSYVTYGVGYKF